MEILVFRVGQLGDMLAALPAFWALRDYFKDDRLTLLSEVQSGRKYVLAPDLLEGAGIFDDFMSYIFHRSRWKRAYQMTRLLARIRSRRFDALVYLYPPERPAELVERDKQFFRLAGIRRFLGMDRCFDVPPKMPGQPLPRLPHEADLTLARLAASKIPIAPSGKARNDLGLGLREAQSVEAWLKGQRSDGGQPWLGIGVGSKMPAKIWPEERYRELTLRLIERFDIWPVVFGGAEDKAAGERLLTAWKRGYNAAGELSVRAAAAALKRCRLFVGNDTGTMHLAAAAKTPCVAIFSARDYPGRWEPYGVPSIVLRREIECEGCMLTECIERRMECLLSIGVDEAVAACAELWTQTGQS